MDFLIDNEIVVDYAKNNVVMFNNDCKKILEKIQNESIDLFVSDIPYRIAKKGAGGIKKQRQKIYAVVCLIVLKIQKKISIILKMGKYLLIMILR